MALSGTAGSVVYFDGQDTAVGEVREWSLDLSAAPVAVTSFGDAADRYIQNLARATGTFAGNFDAASAVQGSVRSDFLNGQDVRLLLYQDGTAYVDAIEAHVTGYSPAVTVDGSPGVEYEFQVSKRIDTNVGESVLLLEQNGDYVLAEDGAGLLVGS